MRPRRLMARALASAALAGAAVFASDRASAFTQESMLGLGTPTGHEFLTIESAPKDLPELQDSDVARLHDANRPLFETLRRIDHLRDKTNLGDEIHYASGLGTKSLAVWSAAIGQRWVDMMGWRGALDKACWMAVAQEPDDYMPDHFMRRTEHAYGAAGRKAAYDEAIARLKRYFRTAFTAAPGLIPVTDSSATRDFVLVDREYFLLGRAMHLLQDSFSPDHTDRAGGNYRMIHDIRNWNCTEKTFQHGRPGKLEYPTNYDSIGDIIWRTRLSPHDASHLKPQAAAALKASRALWTAFVTALRRYRTHDHPSADRIMDETLGPVIAEWFVLSADPPVEASDADRPACPTTPTRAEFAAAAARLEATRLECLRKYSGVDEENPFDGAGRKLHPPAFWAPKTPGEHGTMRPRYVLPRELTPWLHRD